MVFGLGDNNPQEPQQDAPQPPSETGVRLRNALRRAAIWAAVAGVAVLGLGAVGAFMGGSMLLSSGPIGWGLTWLAAKTGLATAALGTAVSTAAPFVGGIVGVAALAGGALGYFDDRPVQASNDEFARTQQQQELQQMERTAAQRRQRVALQRQAAENDRHSAALGTTPGEIGAFLPPSTPLGAGGGGGGGRGRLT